MGRGSVSAHALSSFRRMTPPRSRRDGVGESRVQQRERTLGIRQRSHGLRNCGPSQGHLGCLMSASSQACGARRPRPVLLSAPPGFLHLRALLAMRPRLRWSGHPLWRADKAEVARILCSTQCPWSLLDSSKIVTLSEAASVQERRPCSARTESRHRPGRHPNHHQYPNTQPPRNPRF